MKLIALPLALLLTTSLCFNIDVNHPYIKEGPPNTTFGYQVDFHHVIGNNTYWLIAGAPTANSSSNTSVESPGTIFRCPISDNRYDCQEIPIYYENSGTYGQITKGMFLGVSLRSNGNSILACGHKFTVKVSSPSVEPRMPGRCYVFSSNFSLVAELDPCQRMGPLYYMCMAGMSTDISKDGKFIAFGSIAVHSLTFQGMSSYFESTSRLQRASDIITIARQQIFGFDQFAYTGYSTSFGTFNNTLHVATGAPRGANKFGKVHVMSYNNASGNLVIDISFTGEQLGSYFGSEIRSVDVNNDGLEDLFVGAPSYSREKSRDCGRVYVYMGTKNGLSGSVRSILRGPETNNARFGETIASIGDVNLDGFLDIAVGAPGNEPENSGAIYIYLGSSTGIRTPYAQRIVGKTIDSSFIGFGASISGGKDIDMNQYPDIAVGIGYSNKAVILRSRPILFSDVTLKVIPDHINFNDLNCIEEGQSATCVAIEICFRYRGIGVPTNQEFQYELSILNSDGRLKLKNVDSNGIVKAQMVVAQANNFHCINQLGYAKKNEIREVFSPVNLGLSYSLLNPQQCELCPVIDSSIVTARETNASFVIGCSNNANCNPNLVTSSNYTLSNGGSRAIIGRSETLSIGVRVQNIAEPAYLASVLITLPDFLPFDRVRDATANNVSCELSGRDGGSSTFKCSLGNPLTNNEEVSFNFIARTLYIPVDATSLDIAIYASSASVDLNQDDNRNRFSIPVLYEADLSLNGYSSPLLVRYISRPLNISEFTRMQSIGPLIKHIYRLQNRGPGPVENFLLNVDWPVMYEDVGYLMYLTSSPIISGADGSCTYSVSNLIDPIGVRNRTSRQNLRKKRNAETINKRAYIPDATQLSCDSPKIRCERISCTITGTRSIVDVTFEARLWQNTLNTIRKEGKFLLSSRGRLEPIGAKYLVQPGGKTENIARADSQAMFDAPDVESTPIWIIVVAALAGFFLLSGCVYLLWKCGFFKRKKIEISGPIGAEETENMNGNDEITPPMEEKELTKVDLTDI